MSSLNKEYSDDNNITHDSEKKSSLKKEYSEDNITHDSKEMSSLKEEYFEDNNITHDSKKKSSVKEQYSDEDKITHDFKEKKFDERQTYFRNQLEEFLCLSDIRSTEDREQLIQFRAKMAEERKTSNYKEFSSLMMEKVQQILEDISQSDLEAVSAALVESSVDAEMKQTMLCDHFYTILMAEEKTVPLLNADDNEGPPITRNQQRIFTFLSVLVEKQGFEGLMDKMLDILYYGFFGMNRMYSMSMSNILSLARVFVLCARYLDEVMLIKKFLYDLFYFNSPRNHLVVGVIMDLWPDIFDCEKSSLTPQQEIVLWALFNTGDVKSTADMKVLETRSLMTDRNGFVPADFEPKRMIDKYLVQIHNNRHQDFLSEVRCALLLLGKCNDYQWTHNHITNRLYKLVGQFIGDQELLRWVLETIGLLSRVYTQEGRKKLESMFNGVKDLLDNEDDLEESTVESIVLALIHLGHHLQFQVANFLADWKPKRTLSQETNTRIQDFVGTRGRFHAEKTIEVKKRNESFARIRGGRRRGRGVRCRGGRSRRAQR